MFLMFTSSLGDNLRLDTEAKEKPVLAPPSRVLTDGSKSDERVLPGIDGLVVGPIAIHVSSAIDQPGDVERNGVTED